MDDFKGSADWLNGNEAHDYRTFAHAASADVDKYTGAKLDSESRKASSPRGYLTHAHVYEVASRNSRFAASAERKLFKKLVKSWRSRTKFKSSPQDIVLDDDYQRIIGRGEPVLPLIFKELETNGGYWFWALRAITGHDPVLPNERGQFAAMREAWLSWARTNEYL